MKAIFEVILKTIAAVIKFSSDAAFAGLDKAFELGGESLLPSLLGTITLISVAGAAIRLAHS